MQQWKWLLALIAAIVLIKWVVIDPSPTTNADPRTADLVIVSGSENKVLEPLIQSWAQDVGKQVAVVYQGSVDISRALQQGKAAPFDAVWTANHLWIELGDTQKVVRNEQSIYRSPIVLAVKKSIAKRLGWDQREVKIADILQAAEQHAFRLAMTSATQSNSGASAYLGFLYAMAGYPDTLQAQHLQNPAVQEQLKRLFATTDRSSGSSGWLKEALVQHPERFDAMFNYESLVIEANQQLVQQGQEPLYVIYPQDGLSVADSPLAYIDKGDAAKAALFQQLATYLLSPKVQQQIEASGRRTGLLGMSVTKPDAALWNPAWGIKTDISIASIPIPQREVLQQALTLYQDELRKPSLTVWVLDVSGSMRGAGIQQLKQAMDTLLDATLAQHYWLQQGKDDITLVIPFNHEVQAVWQVKGNDPAQLAMVQHQVDALEASGGTDMYLALSTALQNLRVFAADNTLHQYLPAIAVMTDGRSDETSRFSFQQTLQALPFARDIPIYAIAFGDADPEQLQALANDSIGKLFTVKDNLPSVLREVKGYN